MDSVLIFDLFLVKDNGWSIYLHIKDCKTDVSADIPWIGWTGSMVVEVDFVTPTWDNELRWLGNIYLWLLCPGLVLDMTSFVGMEMIIGLHVHTNVTSSVYLINTLPRWHYFFSFLQIRKFKLHHRTLWIIINLCEHCIPSSKAFDTHNRWFPGQHSKASKTFIFSVELNRVS